MKRVMITILLSGAASLLVLAPPPAWAQEGNQIAAQVRSNLREVRIMEGRLREAEEARVAGRCMSARISIEVLLDQLAGRIEYRVPNEPAPNLPPEVKADMERRAREFLAQDCPPGSGRPLVAPSAAPPATAPTPAPTPPIVPPTEPAPVGSTGTPAPLIDPTRPPPPAQTFQPANPMPPGFRMYQELDGLRTLLDFTIRDCDAAAFGEAKRELLTAIDRYAEDDLSDEGRTSLRVRRQEADALQFPQPCPPEEALFEQYGPGGTRPNAPRPQERPVTGPGVIVTLPPAPDGSAADDCPPASSPGGASPNCPEEGLQQPGAFGDYRDFVDAAFDALIGQANLPRTGSGFVRDGAPGVAPDAPAGQTESRVNMLGVGLGISFPLGGIRARLIGSYIEGNARNIFEVAPPSGGATGRVNGALSPSGSSGTSGPFAVAGQTEVEASALEIIFRPLVLTRGRIAPAEPSISVPYEQWTPGFGFDLYFGGGYGITDKLDVSNISGLVVSGGSTFTFGQNRRQRIQEQQFSLGVSADAAIPLGPRLVARLGGYAGGYYRVSDLESVEVNTSNFGPASDRNFTIEIEDSDNGFGFRSEASAALEWWLTPRVAISIGGGARYDSSVGAIFNPSSGDQVFVEGLTTSLRSDDSWSYGAQVRLRIGLR